MQKKKVIIWRGREQITYSFSSYINADSLLLHIHYAGIYTHIFSINMIGIYFPVWGGYGVGGSGWGDAHGKKS